MSKPTHEKLFLGDIEVPAGRRSLNEATVRDIADSMRAVGQLQPITVIDTGESYRLISGAHRVAAARLIADAIPFAEWEDHPGIGSINAIVLPHNWDGNPRLIEISENLHRAELTALERSELTAEWIRLTSPADKPFQVETVSAKGGRGKEGGVNAAARELGISKTDAHRAVKVAALSPEAKEAARDAGLADNQAALLDAAKEKEPERQVAALHWEVSNQTTVLFAPARGHSIKPREFYDLVESLVPAPRYADLFSRYRHNKRWDCHGDEAPALNHAEEGECVA